MAIKKKSAKPKIIPDDGILNSIKYLFDDQRKRSEKRDAQVNQQFDQLEKRSEKRDAQVNQQFSEMGQQISSLRHEGVQQNTALREEIGVKTATFKKDLVQSVGTMFEEVHERITNEIRQVIVLQEQLRSEMKNTMASTQMITGHEGTIKNHGTRIENMETEIRTIKTIIKKPEQIV